MRRRVENRKPLPAVLPADGKRKPHHQKPSLGGVGGAVGGGGGSNKPSPLHHLQHAGSEEMDSENTASVYDSESNSDDSSSESTITDSSQEDASSNSTFAPPPAAAKSSSSSSSSRGKKPKPLQTSAFRRTSEEALDLFISAAKALDSIVPPEVALHDHSYAQPPTALANSMDLQGTSGLSLIAAAAAVVSPTLSKNAASAKLPSLSPVRAPRGRPPNSQRKGTNSTASKLAPTLLSPAGTSPSVLLTEMKAAPLRGRTRSAPSDRPKVSTLHVPRTGSTLARMSINSSNRTVNRASLTTPPASYSRHKGGGDSSGGSGKNTSSLKSMIAFHTSSATSSSHSHTPSPPTYSSGKPANASSTSAFEALVNVAVAAPPAELPVSVGGNHSKSASPVATPAFTATPLSRSHQLSGKDAVTIGVAGSNSNASNSGSTTTAYIDVNQAINILASFAQQQVSSSAANGSSGGSQSALPVLSNARGLFAPNFLGVSQGGKAVPGGALAATTGPPSSGSKGGKAVGGVSATVDTLLGHLTSGMTSQVAAAVAVGGKKTPGGGAKVKSSSNSKSEERAASNAVNSVGGGKVGSKVISHGNALSGPPAQSIQLMGSVDDLSNLNLLSSLVAAVAASQSATPTSSSSSSSHKTASVGQPSSLHNNSSSSSKTDTKRPLEAVVSALSAARMNSSSPSQADSTSNSSSYILSHTPTPSDDGLSTSSSLPDAKQERELDKLIAASSSIKKAPLQSSSSGGNVYGAPAGMTVSASGAAAGELPRSVVRTGLGLSDQQLENSVSPGSTNSNELVSSLASVIPPYNPSSMSSQSSLLLYTRSLSFPLAVSSDSAHEEEDHLESATRGISELSKLLGTTDSTTDNGGGAPPTSTTTTTRHERVYKGVSNWNPSELLSAVPSNKNDFASGLSEKSGKPYLSSLLESQIHGTVHHTSMPAPKLNSSSTNSSRSESLEAPLDIDHSR